MFTFRGRVLSDFISKVECVVGQYGGSVTEHIELYDHGHCLVIFNPFNGRCFIWRIVPASNVNEHGFYNPWAFKTNGLVDLILV